MDFFREHGVLTMFLELAVAIYIFKLFGLWSPDDLSYYTRTRSTDSS